MSALCYLQRHVLSRGYLHEPLRLPALQHCLRHLRPSLAVSLLRHRGLSSWLRTEDSEAEAPGPGEHWRPAALPGEMANRLEKWCVPPPPRTRTA